MNQAALICLLTYLVLAPGTTFAAFTSGNDLLNKLRACEKNDQGDESYDNYYGCAAVTFYVRGIHDGLESADVTTDFEMPFCMPIEVTSGQMNAVVGNYMKANPAELHKSGAVLVINALMEGFPCN